MLAPILLSFQELLKTQEGRREKANRHSGENAGCLRTLADPDDFVTNNYKCGMAINVQKSCSKEMDAILEEAKSAPTQDARKAAYKSMQDLSLQEMDIVPLVNAWLLIAYAKNLRGFTPLRTGFLKTLKDSWFES